MRVRARVLGWRRKYRRMQAPEVVAMSTSVRSCPSYLVTHTLLEVTFLRWRCGHWSAHLLEGITNAGGADESGTPRDAVSRASSSPCVISADRAAVEGFKHSPSDAPRRSSDVVVGSSLYRFHKRRFGEVHLLGEQQPRSVRQQRIAHSKHNHSSCTSTRNVWT
jgi:hypothetical protein